MPVSEKEILRYLGYREAVADHQTMNNIKQIVVELEKRVNPKNTYGIWECRVTPISVVLGEITINSSSLAQHLKECSCVALIGATLGIEADALVRQYSVRDMEKAVIAGAVCTAMIEAYCDSIESEIEQNLQKSLRSIGRFSPGYGDFDIVFQKNIVSLLNCGKRIGLGMTDGYMLTPSKSVTAVIGLAIAEKRCYWANNEQYTKHIACENNEKTGNYENSDKKNETEKTGKTDKCKKCGLQNCNFKEIK